MVCFPVLPPELWATILAHRRNDRRTLAACGSVSWLFASLAQPHLFRKVSIRSAREYLDLLALIQANPSLLQTTVHASIEGNVMDKPNWLDREAFSRLSKCLRSVQSVKLAYIPLTELLTQDAGGEDQAIWSAKQLHLVSCILGRKPARVLDIYRFFPDVCDFRVIDCTWDPKRPSAELPPSPLLSAGDLPSYPPLSRLTLSSCRCAVELTPWIVLSGAMRDVEMLSFTLDNAESAEALVMLCRAAGPALRELRILVHTSPIDTLLGGTAISESLLQLGPDVNPHLERLVLFWSQDSFIVTVNPVPWIPDLVDRTCSHPQSRLALLTIPCPPLRRRSKIQQSDPAFTGLNVALARAVQGRALSKLEFIVAQSRRTGWREKVAEYLPDVPKCGIEIADVLRAEVDPDTLP